MTLAPYTDQRLNPFPHGFFTRAVDDPNGEIGLYETLNLGRGSQDEPPRVEHNRNRVRAHLGADMLLTAYQVHSAQCLTIDASNVEAVSDLAKPVPQADALVTRLPGIAVGVLTADCAPILFADPTHNIIGAAHAGWRGAVGGIIEATIEALLALGAQRETICASIGPSISLPNYEVGDSFYEALQHNHPDGLDFCQRLGPTQSWHFDLGRYCESRLARAQIAHHRLPICTYGHPAEFFSYRYNTHLGLTDYGRQGSFIMIPKPA